MQISLVLIASLIASATAAVVNSTTLEKRQALEVIICKDLYLEPGPTGGCTGIVTDDFGCSPNFATLTQDGGGWNDIVSSAAIAYEGGPQFHCKLYEHPDCNGRQLLLTGPAYDLREQDFDDIASSVRCWWI